jgi:hypothetical protein
MREEHRLLFGPASKDIFGRYDQASQRCGEVIAKLGSPTNLLNGLPPS